MSAQRFDAVIVGGGVIGLACAWRAVRRGLRVCVLERDRVGAGASRVAAGRLAPISEADFGEEALLRLNLAAAERWPSFAAELSAEVGYERRGSVYVALDRDELEALARLHELRRSLSLESSLLSGSGCRRLEPGLATRVAGGLHAPGEAQADPRRLLAVLAGQIQGAGGEIRSGVEVTEVGPDLARCGDGSAVTGRVVVASGAWAAQLVPLPVRPVKGQILRLRGPLPAERIVRSQHVYVVPRAGGEVVVGATTEERGFDTSVTAGAVHELLREAYRTLPGIAELELVEATAGLRPGSPDNRPFVRALSDGTLVACGHYRNGVLLAPLTGEAVAALLAGEEPPAELRAVEPPEVAAA
jgi:glycine oxidase